MTKNGEKKKQILLTFDYELFLGKKSGTSQKCLIEPTNKLLAVFRKCGIKGTFFVDVLYYKRLLESDATLKDAGRIKQQLQDIVAQGSRIELHLHPHWLDAIYTSGEWQFPSYDRFRLQRLSEESIAELFAAGVGILEGIAREVRPDYRIMAFRAGGFCVQPFAPLRRAFLSNGISIDSSVATGMAGESATHQFDFQRAPDQAWYRFEYDPNIPVPHGPLLEFPIATYRKNFAAKLRLKVVARLSKRRFSAIGDGEGLSFPISWWKKLLTVRRMLTLDNEMLTSELLREIAASDRPLVTIISHPKFLSAHSFECLERLCAKSYAFVGIDEAAGLAGASQPRHYQDGILV